MENAKAQRLSSLYLKDEIPLKFRNVVSESIKFPENRSSTSGIKLSKSEGKSSFHLNRFGVSDCFCTWKFSTIGVGAAGLLLVKNPESLVMGSLAS